MITFSLQVSTLRNHSCVDLDNFFDNSEKVFSALLPQYLKASPCKCYVKAHYFHFLIIYFIFFQPWFRKLIEIEGGLQSINAINKPNIFSTMSVRRLGIEDDHIPFLRRSKYSGAKLRINKAPFMI